jgi:hypothetical protein
MRSYKRSWVVVTSAEEYTASLLAAALDYASGGLPVFPIWGPFKKDVCQCKAGKACKSIAKHPLARLVPNGHLDATTDAAQVHAWWAAWPRANVGIAVPPGLAVLDVDGFDGIVALGERGWKIPETVTAATPRGWHHWFEAEVEIRPGSDFMPHVDMRGPGGYVVAPPSLHRTGIQYEWERPFTDFELVAAPPWLYDLVKEARQNRHRPPEASNDSAIIEGQRNDMLARIAGAMRRWGCPEAAILSALQITNAERCRPPLDDEEVAVIASSVARYAPERLVDGRATWEPYGWQGEPW